jgi:hypothetical protein
MLINNEILFFSCDIIDKCKKVDKSYNGLRHLLTYFIRNPFEKPQNYINISFKLILFSLSNSQPFCRYLKSKSELEHRNKDLEITKTRPSSPGGIRRDSNRKKWNVEREPAAISDLSSPKAARREVST